MVVSGEGALLPGGFILECFATHGKSEGEQCLEHSLS